MTFINPKSTLLQLPSIFQININSFVWKDARENCKSVEEIVCFFFSQLKCTQVKPNEFKQDFLKSIILKKIIFDILIVFSFDSQAL